MIRDDFATNALSAGIGATLATTAAMTAIAKQHDGSPWTLLNSVSHIAWGNEAGTRRQASAKYTVTGAALNTAAVMSWAVVLEALRRAMPRSSAGTCAAAATTAALAYLIDYHVVPQRLTPGFELRLPRRRFAPIYAALAAGLAVGALAAQRRSA